MEATDNPTLFVADDRHEEYDEPDHISYPEAPQAEYDEGGDAVCAVCGELLAWHEEICGATPLPQPVAKEATMPIGPALSSTFAYELGHQVQPAPSSTARVIIWRGQVRERHPSTGLVHRVNVYRLDNGFWDCYYEEELQAA